MFNSPGTGETETYRHISKQDKQLLPCPEATQVCFIYLKKKPFGGDFFPLA